MNYLKHIRVVTLGKHHQLALTKITDRTTKPRAKHLFLYSIIPCIEKHRPTVESDAVANSCEICRQHGDRPTLVTDMVVNMINCFSPYDVGRKYGLHKINQLVDEPSEPGPRSLKCKTKSSSKPDR